MKAFKNNKLLHSHTPNIYSLNFKKLPKRFWEEFPKEDSLLISDMLFIRDEQRKRLILNESVSGWNVLLRYIVPLDLLPDVILKDLFFQYQKIYKGITVRNIQTFNDDVTLRRTIYCLIPEILWCHGITGFKSLIFFKD